MMIPEDVKAAGASNRLCRVNGRFVEGIDETAGSPFDSLDASQVQIKIELDNDGQGITTMAGSQ
jgi:hypothetical protein